jgi:hypothetical protein
MFCGRILFRNINSRCGKEQSFARALRHVELCDVRHVELCDVCTLLHLIQNVELQFVLP